MLPGMDLRRQARVCARLAEHCEDRYLAERLRDMAADLLAAADGPESLPGEQLDEATLVPLS